MEIINMLDDKKPEANLGDLIIDQSENYHMIVQYEDLYYSLDLRTIVVDQEGFEEIDDLIDYFGYGIKIVPKERLSLTLK
jgi:hypothetical protein